MTAQKKFASLALLLVMLAACAPNAGPQPTAPPATLPPTWTPSPQATGLPTSTEIPTFTPVPAFTPLSTPTRDSVGALSERFQDSLFSPNGRWTAYRDPDKLRVVHSEDPLRYWTLPCALFDECSTIYPIKWSRNSQILYFAPAPAAGGAPTGLYLVTALATLDVRSGEWDLLLPDSNRHYDFSFSPGDEYLVYAQSSGSLAEEQTITLGIVNMEDPRQRQEYTMDGVYAGNFIWSPFKPRFVFSIYDPQQGSIVGYYDIETGFLKHAIELEGTDILLLDWGQDNLVSIEVKDRGTSTQTYRQLNPFSGELIGGSFSSTPSE
jgi:hypothetical protein